MEFCGNVLGELNVVTIMRLTTTLCVSFSIRSNNCTILSSSVYTSTKSPSSQPSVLPALCLHFYNISVKLALGSSGFLSTLLQHLRQVIARFFHLSVYTSTTSPSSQPSVLPGLCLHYILHLRQISPH